MGGPGPGFAIEQCTLDVRDDDGDPAFSISGIVGSSGKLRFAIRTTIRGVAATQSGESLFRLMIDYFRGEGVASSMLVGEWRVGELARLAEQLQRRLGEQESEHARTSFRVDEVSGVPSALATFLVNLSPCWHTCSRGPHL